MNCFFLSAQDRGGAAGHTGSQGGEAAAQGPEAGPAGPECPAQAGAARGPQVCGRRVGRVPGAGCYTDHHSSSRKKSLAGMKRARAEADGDSDAEDPGAPPEAERAGQQEEEDEAEYFRQAVGEEPDEGAWRGSAQPGTGTCPCPGDLTPYFFTDMFPKAQRRRSTRPPSKKQRLKQRRPDCGSDHRPRKAKGRPWGTQAKLGPRGAVQNYGRGRAQPPKRVA